MIDEQMTDKDKWIDFLGSMSIPFSIQDGFISVATHPWRSTKVIGHSGAEFAVYFNEDGSLESVGVWG